MVVFNLNALAQVIILAIIVGLCLLFNLDIENFFIFYILFFTIIGTYKAGLKGKFFWIIPTWIIAVVIMWVYINNYFYDDSVANKVYASINYLILIYISFRMIFEETISFNKDFSKADLILKNLNKTDSYFENNRNEFWAQITHTFVRPSFFYKNLNSVYQFFNKQPVTQIELIDHYLLLMASIKPRVSVSTSSGSIDNMIDYLKKNRSNGSFSYEFLERLAEIIDMEVKLLGLK